MTRIVLFAACAAYLFACYAAGTVSASARQAPPSAGTSRTVWEGVFTGAQADRGETLYGEHCAECHGGDLLGRQGKALAGEQFWMDWAETSVGDLLTYVSKNMPYAEDGSLAGTLPISTYTDIVAHMLRVNGFPAGGQELNLASSAAVRIIRKNGPGELPASTLARVIGCLAPRGADGSWRVLKATRPERTTASAPKPAQPVPLGDREFALKFVLGSLNSLVGHRVIMTGLLIGEGGADGLNVSSVDSLAQTCE